MVGFGFSDDRSAFVGVSSYDTPRRFVSVSILTPTRGMFRGNPHLESGRFS